MAMLYSYSPHTPCWSSAGGLNEAVYCSSCRSHGPVCRLQRRRRAQPQTWVLSLEGLSRQRLMAQSAPVVIRTCPRRCPTTSCPRTRPRRSPKRWCCSAGVALGLLVGQAARIQMPQHSGSVDDLRQDVGGVLLRILLSHVEPLLRCPSPGSSRICVNSRCLAFPKPWRLA
jgi:hypothetical protein